LPLSPTAAAVVAAAAGVVAVGGWEGRRGGAHGAPAAPCICSCDSKL
jgi:hypothetical protein